MLSSISFKYQTVDNPASSVNQVNGINRSSDIVGTTGSGSKSDPYVSYISQPPYDTFQDETYKNAQGTVAMNINSAASQTVIGGWVINPPSLPGIWAFVQINGLWTIFRNLKGGRGPNTATEMLGINDEGFGVGWFKNTNGNSVPVVINIPTEKFTALKPPGYLNAEATGINDVGDIAGWETTSSGTIGFFERIGTVLYVRLHEGDGDVCTGHQLVRSDRGILHGLGRHEAWLHPDKPQVGTEVAND